MDQEINQGGGDEIGDSNPKKIGAAAAEEHPSHVIDLFGENQRVCRICHLNAKERGENSVELMELGCGCKGELGVAHLNCAQAWFRVRGNRLCEICGEIAKNVCGVGDIGFMEEWSEGDAISGSSDGSRRCLRGHRLCNFLMACLVIAFVLPWFFRVNVF